VVNTGSSSNSRTGGLVGQINGSGNTVNGSFATGNVSSASAGTLGGLVGLSSGTITNGYATGTVSGSSTVGGLVGSNTGTIDTSYAVGSVSGSSAFGGLVGSNSATVTNSYWDTETSTQASSAGGTGLTTVAMKDQANVATNLDGFEFKTTGWIFSAGVNNDYPVFSGPIRITINLADTTRVYGAANPTLPSFTTTGSWLAGDSLSTIDWGTAAAGNTPAGVHSYSTANLLSPTYTFDTGNSASDYIFSWSTNTLTVTPAPLTITAGATSKTYGQTLSTFAFTSSGLLNSETIGLVYGSSPGAAADVAVSGDSYVVTPTLATSGSFNAANYTITYGNGSLTVNPAVLTYTATASNQAYGSANTVFSGTVTGFVNGESVATATTGTASFVSTTTTTDSAGSYAINGSGLTAISDNYTFTSAAGNAAALTISAATVTIAANAAAKTYDGLSYSGGNGVVYSGFINDDTSAVLGGTLVYGGTAQGAINAGSYTITPSGLTSSNYTLSYVDSIFTVAPATLTYNAVVSSHDYGSAGTAFTGTVTGLVNSESLASATTGTAAFVSTAAASANAGSYAITGSGLTANDGNYTFADAPDNSTAYTINPAVLTYQATASSQNYGSANTTFTGTVTGFVNSESLASATSGTASFVSPTNATDNVGSYAINGGGLTANNGNYRFADASGNTTALTINPALLTYNATTSSQSYGNANTDFTGTVTGFFNGENVDTATTGAASFVSTTTPADNIGSYAINGSGLTAINGNYTFANAAGNAAALTINLVTVTVTANAAGKSYDGLGYSGGNGVLYSGFINDDTSAVLGGTLVYGGTAQGAINAGSYTITASGLTSSNYALSYVDSIFTVAPSILNYNAAVSSRSYGDANTAFTGTVTGFVNSESLASATTGTASFFSTTTAADNVGSYAINGSGLTADNGNYSFANATGNSTALTINPATLTITGMTVDDKVFDGTAAASLVGGTLSGLVNSDTLTFTGHSGAFANETVGNGKAVAVTGAMLVAGTGLADNYTLSNPTGMIADITQPSLTGAAGSAVATVAAMTFVAPAAPAKTGLTTGGAIKATSSGSELASGPLSGSVLTPESGTASESGPATETKASSESDLAAAPESSVESSTALESESSSDVEIASAADSTVESGADSGEKSAADSSDEEQYWVKPASVDLTALNVTMVKYGVKMPKDRKLRFNRAVINNK
jgi:hypothetical protein